MRLPVPREGAWEGSLGRLAGLVVLLLRKGVLSCGILRVEGFGFSKSAVGEICQNVVFSWIGMDWLVRT